MSRSQEEHELSGWPSLRSYTEQEDEALFAFTAAGESPDQSELDNDELDSQAAEDNVDRADDATKVSRWSEFGKILGILVGGWVVAKVLDCFVALARNKPDCVGLSEEQKKNTQLDVDKLRKMSDQELWTALASWVKQSHPAGATQFYDVSFLAKARATDHPIKLDAEDAVALVRTLSKLDQDDAVYTYMVTYTNKGIHLDFSSAADYVKMALVKRYPSLAD